MKDILYTTRTKNKITGWNDNKEVYSLDCLSLEIAKKISLIYKKYLKFKNSIPERYTIYIESQYNKKG